MAEKNELITSNAAFLDAYKLKSPDIMPDKPFTHDIFLLETYIAGIHHVRGFKSRIKKVDVGDRLILLREPKNEYDDLAILVHNAENKKLGYIPRRNNKVIARLMDAGKYMYAILDDKPVEIEKDSYCDVRISVYMVD